MNNFPKSKDKKIEDIDKLMNKYDSTNIVVEDNKIDEKSKANPTNKGLKFELKQILSFIFTCILIFLILLVITNAQAYYQMISFWWGNSFGHNNDVTTLTQLTNEENISKTNLLPTENIVSSNVSKNDQSLLDINIPITPNDNRIILPTIGKNIPIVDISADNLIKEDWDGLEDDIQKGLEKGVVRYPGTAKPGQVGNVFITGHSSYYLWAPGKYKDVFALLHNVEVGQKIIVYYNQNKFEYLVTEKKIVGPKDVDVLRQTEDKRLTLMTCTPVGTAINRLIIVGEQTN